MNIIREVQKLDMQMIEMMTTLDNIKDNLEQPEEIIIDIDKIEKYAIQSKFLKHIIENLDEELAYKYCVALASAIDLVEEKEKKIKQFYYIFRIYHVHYSSQISENLLRDSKIFSMDDWELLLNGVSADEKRNLLVDFLLMISLDGMPDSKQAEYLCEIFAYADYKEKDIRVILQLVKAILVCDKEQMYELVDKINVNYYIPYLGSKLEFYVLGDISQIASCDSPNIMIVNGNIRDKNQQIDLDQFGKSSLIFKNCQFENVVGLVAKKTKVYLKECFFKNCKQNNLKSNTANSIGLMPFMGSSRYKYNKSDKKKFLLELTNAKLENTTFKNCFVEGFANNSSLLKLIDSEIISCKFDNCRIGVHADSKASCAIIDADRTTVENCIFSDCSSYGEGEYGRFDYFYMYIVKAGGGKVIDNIFTKCKCDGENVNDKNFNNYILAYSNNTYEKNNTFSECTTTQCRFDDSFTHNMKGKIE
ncbi:MAG: hypothetical protein Q4F28_04000 [Eubacteriales bacterium]|nr:hypothetical protein [Eubacteriales bacterium]